MYFQREMSYPQTFFVLYFANIKLSKTVFRPPLHPIDSMETIELICTTKIDGNIGKFN